MDWDFFAKYILVPTLLTVAFGAGAGWLTRAERSFRRSHDLQNDMTGVLLKVEQLEKLVETQRCYGDRLTRVESELGHVKNDTGEIKVKLDKLLEHARRNGNGG